jgi:hypothetical protein
MGRRYGDVIVVQRAPIVRDQRTGNETRDWSAATLSAPVPADVQPAGQSELNDNRQVTISRWTVICDPADVLATDRVLWQGAPRGTDGAPVPLEVDGEVGTLMHHGVPDHLEFTVKRFS